MLNGIDLFSGYGGISLALSEYVRPIVYCEIEPFAQGILLSRMDDGSIPFAPIWDDVTTINGKLFNGLADIVYGGFPCQDISVAGKGAGLEGKRSGLFYEVLRVCKEASPQFIFLENVPAIRTRGSIEVAEALASIGYDCRFGTLSAKDVGACHKRQRWFLLASNANGAKLWEKSRRSSRKNRQDTTLARVSVGKRDDSNSDSFTKKLRQPKEWVENPFSIGRLEGDNWHDYASFLLGMGNGDRFRSHRIKALGNGVVPLQVKTAFETLMGIQ